ncbi:MULTISPECIES: hypothetical protein [Methylomonas]|uniref:hypothetical protein n=1 Tax=Methylomonas TaxID=416 RepID=UPI0007C8B9C6|nr:MULTISPECIES: hypothetical protein [Methylomonas]ANE54484.1 hypothetical protein AYM39_04295 [Methylomonas sp. DH-1]WNB76786.1 hypothetical protein RI210_04230 [Methylomonas koyamae]
MKYRNQIIKYSALAMLFAAGNASAESVFDALTTAVTFTDLIAAMSTIYAGIVVVGLFFIGGDIITRKLGWKKG